MRSIVTNVLVLAIPFNSSIGTGIVKVLLLVPTIVFTCIVNIPGVTARPHNHIGSKI